MHDISQGEPGKVRAKKSVNCDVIERVSSSILQALVNSCKFVWHFQIVAVCLSTNCSSVYLDTLLVNHHSVNDQSSSSLSNVCLSAIYSLLFVAILCL